MHFKHFTRVLAIVCLALTAGGTARAASGNKKCELPHDLAVALEKEYSGSRPLVLADLDEDSRSLFLKEHGPDCPGYVSADFYGDKRPTLAIVLITKAAPRKEAKLVVAHKPDGTWHTRVVDSAKNSIPVVWTMKPGTYEDIYGKKVIRARHPVIVLCVYESWSTLYSWSATHVSKIWITD